MTNPNLNNPFDPGDAGVGLSADPADNRMTSLKIANTGNVDPAGDFYVEGVMPGDLYFQPAVMPPVAGDEGVVGVGLHWRKVFDERERRGESQGAKTSKTKTSKTIATWSTDPPDAEFISGKGGGYLRPNGNLIAPRAEIFFLVNKEPVCLTAYDFDGIKLAQKLNAAAMAQTALCSDGTYKRPPFYGTKWRITTQPKVVETANGPSEVHMYAFEPVGVIGESVGPTADQYRRGQALHETLKASDYPPFSSVAVIPLRRFVNGSPGAGRNAPLPESEDDYGASAPANDDHDQIPF